MGEVHNRPEIEPGPSEYESEGPGLSHLILSPITRQRHAARPGGTAESGGKSRLPGYAVRGLLRGGIRHDRE
jgi:hypothetical protein